MSNNYDNWERLVRAVLLREKLRQIALSPSINSSCVTSASSSFRLSSSSPINDSFVFNRSFPLPAANSGPMSNPNDQEITSRSASLSFFLDERTGKNCCMVGARGLLILWAVDSRYWKWTAAQAGSRFLEIAELQSVPQLDIRCKIQSRILPQRNTYAAHLVYKLAKKCKGLKSTKATIRFINDESDEDAEKRAHIVHLQTVEDRNRPVVVTSEDGWKEVEIGNFYVGQEDDGEVEARLMEKNMRLVKSGLIVGGIQFRPMYKYGVIPLVSKQCRSRIVRV